ncbi:MAG: hypothetical protein DWB48_08435 [Nitrosomonas sp.]|nr:hypothetical protein [Nitrosomonas sp.]
MTQASLSLPPEKLLERVLRVAELLTLPVKPIASVSTMHTVQPNTIIPEDEAPSEMAAKTVKLHFRVK